MARAPKKAVSSLRTVRITSPPKKAKPVSGRSRKPKPKPMPGAVPYPRADPRKGATGEAKRKMPPLGTAKRMPLRPGGAKIGPKKLAELRKKGVMVKQWSGPNKGQKSTGPSAAGRKRRAEIKADIAKRRKSGGLAKNFKKGVKKASQYKRKKKVYVNKKKK